jgi:hypothetical protein
VPPARYVYSTSKVYFLNIKYQPPHVSRSLVHIHMDPSLSLLPPQYALYPFSSSRPLFWTQESSSLYRVRKVGQWIGGSPAFSGDKNRWSECNIINLERGIMEVHDIRRMLCGDFHPADQSRLNVTARFVSIIYRSTS